MREKIIDKAKQTALKFKDKGLSHRDFANLFHATEENIRKMSSFVISTDPDLIKKEEKTGRTGSSRFSAFLKGNMLKKIVASGTKLKSQKMSKKTSNRRPSNVIVGTQMIPPKRKRFSSIAVTVGKGKQGGGEGSTGSPGGRHRALQSTMKAELVRLADLNNIVEEPPEALSKTVAKEGKNSMAVVEEALESLVDDVESVKSDVAELKKLLTAEVTNTRDEMRAQFKELAALLAANAAPGLGEPGAS
jgi:hypothetical protein